MKQRIKKLGCYITIILLLPYVVTVFINGPEIVSSSNVDKTCITVKTNASDSTGTNDEADAKTMELPIEDYCIGIMAKEIPADYEKDALMAQAVLIRTDIYRKIASEGSSAVFDKSFQTQEEMESSWGATRYSRYYNRLKSAWQETEGQILMYEDSPAKTPFFRLSNGSTRDGKEVLGEEYPYLKPVDCPADLEAEQQIQTVTFPSMDAEILKCDSIGYVLQVRSGKEQVSGEEFRTTYQLASSCFTLQNFNDKIRITTRGIGHGLGMSQYTANILAKEGKNYEEILEYFFAGTTLEEVTDIVKK